MIRNLLIAILFASLILSCNEYNSFQSKEEKQDTIITVKKIIGNWLSTYNNANSNLPGNLKYFKGIQILGEHKIEKLGLDYLEGTLKPMTNSFYLDIANITDSTFYLTYIAPPSIISENIMYKISQDTLYIKWNQYFTETFIYSPSHEILDKGIDLEFRFDDNNGTWKSPRVYYYIPSYCYQIQSDSLSIIGVFGEKNNYIQFTVSNYTGLGVYNLGKKKASISFDGDDYREIYYTSDDSSGFIQITKFDLNTNRCTGNFSFIAKDIRYGNNFGERVIKNGIFDIPIYK